jgi:D-proline reductase (dithiol) PrdB
MAWRFHLCASSVARYNTAKRSTQRNENVARLDDVELTERLLLKAYPFSRYGPRSAHPASMAVTPLRKPLSACTVALVTTAGLSLADQPPFDTSIRMGDSSFREFPGDISPQTLQMNHRSWVVDQTDILRDRNLVLPLDRLREMQARGEIGAIAPRHYSFMGSIIGPARLIKQSAPEVARRLMADRVDVAMLTPV